jgi:hypothetical protein
MTEKRRAGAAQKGFSLHRKIQKRNTLTNNEGAIGISELVAHQTQIDKM